MSSRPHAIVRNDGMVVARFPSLTSAREAYYDLGCHLDEMPRPEDAFAIVDAKTGEVADPVSSR
jgi:hypothetical protein